MADQTQQLQGLFPDVPRETPVVDKDGNFTDLWSLGFGALFQALQENFKSEGILFPPLSAANALVIQNLYARYIGLSYNSMAAALPDISGQTIYNQTTQATNQFIIAQDGTGNVTLAEWVPMGVMLTSTGTPNGTQAGLLSWQYYDTMNNHLWICSTSGAIGTAVWTQII